MGNRSSGFPWRAGLPRTAAPVGWWRYGPRFGGRSRGQRCGGYGGIGECFFGQGGVDGHVFTGVVVNDLDPECLVQVTLQDIGGAGEMQRQPRQV